MKITHLANNGDLADGIRSAPMEIYFLLSVCICDYVNALLLFAIDISLNSLSV